MTDDGEHRGIWVVIEPHRGRPESVSLEMLGRARQLADESGDEVVALVLGHGVAPFASEAAARGADRVVVVDDPVLADYTTDAYTAVVTRLVRERRPAILLLGATHNGRDLAGRLAVRLRTGLTADAVDLVLRPDVGLVAYTPGLGGRILAACACPVGRPQMATVRPGVFPLPAADHSRTIRVERVPADVDPADVRTEVLERSVGETVDLTQARRIVIAGLGTGGDLTGARELAALLDAEVGVTRPLADEGLVPRDYQIGTTGVTLRPDLAVVLGASGAMHFANGIEGAGTIVTINSDAEAPIFDQSDVGAVADLNRLLPLLVARVRERRGAGELTA